MHSLTLAAILLAACASTTKDASETSNGGATQTAGSGGSNGGSAGATASGGTSATAGKGGASPTTTGGNTGTTGGTAGSTPAAVIPTLVGGNYLFSFDGYVFEVSPAKGGRVITFSLDGKNILTGPSANPDNYGSTFWPSPQSAWNWPPPAEIDRGAFTATVDGDALVLQSQPSATVKLSVTKRFSVDRAAKAVVITYEMKNTASAAATWAPWEITRVPPGGMTFFSLGAGGTAAIGTWVPMTLEPAAGWSWFDDATLQIADNKGRKTFADGKGWIAHVARTERLLLVKTFEDVAKDAQAKDEAEIEVFVDSARKYVEVENQGAALPLAAGATRSWTVRWSLRALPATGTFAVGAAAVVDATKSIVGGL